MQRNVRRLSPSISLLALLAATPLVADVLVLRDGTRLATRGAWSERGALVVFTAADGVLRSLRAREVDLERSRQATAEAERRAAEQGAKPAPSPASALPPLRFTEANFPPVEDPESLTPGVRLEQPIVLYSTSWCGWCRKTRALFAELGVGFVEHDVEQNARAALELQRLTAGSRSVPVVDWRGEVVRGFAESRFRELAAAERRAAQRGVEPGEPDAR